MKVLHIVILGDSTVATYEQNSKIRGWGQMIGVFLLEDVEIINLASGGQSTKTFIHQGRLDEALKQKVDFALIQFGHNDSHSKDKPESTNADTDYKDYLRIYADRFRELGVNPIFITPVHRRIFTAQGQITQELLPYAEAMKQVAVEKGIPVVDLHTISGELFEKLGEEGTVNLFCHPEDRSHFSEKGALTVAKLVIQGLWTVEPPTVGGLPQLRKYIKNEIMEKI